MIWPIIFNGTINPRLQATAIVISLGLLITIIQFVRRERLKEGYAILWLGVSLVLVVFSLWADLLQVAAVALGEVYAPAVWFLLVTGGLLALSLHFSLLLCRYDRRIRTLAQEHAMLKLEMEQMIKLQNGKINQK